MMANWRDFGSSMRWPLACLLVGLACSLLSVGCDSDRALAVRRLNQALTQYEEGDVKAAVALLERAAEADQAFAKPHYQLGQLYEYDKRVLEKAETHYQRAAALAPDRAEYHYSLGRVLEKREDSEDAIEAFQRAVEAREDFPEAWFRLGISQRHVGEFAEAVESLERSIRGAPRMRLGEEDPGGSAYNALGDIYVRFGFFHKALQVFEDGIENNAEAARLYRGRGVAQLELERFESAASSFEQSLELESDVATAYFNLAVARRQSGDVAGAIDALRRYLDGAARREDRAKVAAARGKIETLEEASGVDDG